MVKTSNAYLDTRVILTDRWNEAAPDHGLFGNAAPILRAKRASGEPIRLLGAIATGVVGTLVSAGISAAGSLLSLVGQDRAEQSSALCSLHFFGYDEAGQRFGLNQAIRSILVVRGRFDDGIAARDPKAFDARWQGGDRQALAKEIHLAETPQLLFEGLLRPSLDNGKFEIVPLLFEINCNQFWNPFGRRRDYVFDFAFRNPPDPDHFAVGHLAFTGLTPPRALVADQMHGMTTGWMAMPALSGASKDRADALAAFDQAKDAAAKKDAAWHDAYADLRNRLALLTAQLSWTKEQREAQQTIFDLQRELDQAENADVIKTHGDADRADLVAALYDLQPVNLAVQVTETRKANVYLQKIAAALNAGLDANKGALQTAVVDRLTGATEAAARKLRSAAVKDVRTKYKALLDARAAAAAATDPTAKQKAAVDLDIARDDFNEAVAAARQAGADPGSLPTPP